MNTVVLNNEGPPNLFPDSYYPRLQINNRTGEIVLAVHQGISGLTTGILVDKTADSKSPFGIGKKFTDWEVAGELVDYDGEVAVLFKNKVPCSNEK